MNFRQVATEIMLHANEEKWYETRERIENALELARMNGEVEWCAAHGYHPKHEAVADVVERASKEIVEVERAEGYIGLFQIQEILCKNLVRNHWRDQPDGVR